MNPKSNLALVPQASSPNELHLHVQELRHLGLLRRFKRACGEREDLDDLQHDTDRLRFDPPYRNKILHALARSEDAKLKVWIEPVTAALDALDVIHEHMKASGEHLKALTRPQEFAEMQAVPEHKDLPSKTSPNWGGRWRWHMAAIALLLVGSVAGALVWQHQTSLRPGAQTTTLPVEQLAPVVTAFRLHGSNTIGEALAPALVNAFVRQQSGQLAEVRSEQPLEKLITYRANAHSPLQGIELHAHGSGTAYTSLKDGKADIGMSSRPIKDAENAALTPLYGDMRSLGAEHVIGLDGLAVIVHPGNKIEKLTVEQVAGIFSGRFTNWQELGGSDTAIVLHARDDKSGTWDSFKSMVLERHKATLGASALRYESSNALSDAVASTPGGIGFIGLPFVRQSRAVPVADTAASTAFLPSFFTVSTEDYPLSRRLFLYAPMQRLSAQTKEFIEFVQSDAGQEVVRQIGFVPQLIAAESVSAAGNAPKEYAQLTHTAQRLSFTFRFRSGSDELDSKATRDMARLLSYLARHPEKPVYLLGFTDAVGVPQRNVQLSKSRADSVAHVLNSSGVVPKQVLGLGGSLPVASNDDDLGRNRNRRVEVWVGS